MSAAAPSERTATVTGATGYVASELIRQLLERGYRIKATVRCAPDDPRLAPLLRAAEGSEGSLELVQARGQGDMCMIYIYRTRPMSC